MQCCQCQGIEAEFERKAATAELRQFRRRGPAKTTRMLVDALKAGGVEGMTLLDIGGGVGAIQHELLKTGVRTATGVDASTAYIEAARAEAERLGHGDRVVFHRGDFVRLAEEIAPSDIVTLDRVVCCYQDMPSLVELSSARAVKLYGVVYPRDTWWNRVGLATLNVVRWLRRNPFRVFVHRPEAVEAVIQDNGLKRRFSAQTFVWQVVIYARSASATGDLSEHGRRITFQTHPVSRIMNRSVGPPAHHRTRGPIV